MLLTRLPLADARSRSSNVPLSDGCGDLIVEKQPSFFRFANSAGAEQWSQRTLGTLWCGTAIIIPNSNQPLGELTEFNGTIAEALFKEFGDFI